MSRIRRDPRAERAMQGVGAVVRPRYDLGHRTTGNRRPRLDPRAELIVIEVHGSASPRRRYDRTQTTALIGRLAAAETDPAHAADRAVQPPKILVVETPAFLVFAYLDLPGGRLSRVDRQILGAARLLADAGAGGGAVVALAFASSTELGAAGADRVIDLSAEARRPASVKAEAIGRLITALDPRHVLFAESGEGADLARRLAVKLAAPLLADVEHLTARQATRAARGRRAEEAGPPPRLLTLGEDRVAAWEGEACEARSQDRGPDADIADPAILSDEIIPGDPATLTLAESDFVVSAGNGVSDFEGFRALARRLKGTPGGSRVVCDAGLMPREAQVGASGTVLAADAYLALGIAGAPQHLQGVAGCEHVIAVNTDLHAAMIERAGLAIVMDAQRVIPALIALIDEKEGKERA